MSQAGTERDYASVAEALWQAERERRPIAPISAEGEWTIADAYRIQREYVGRKQVAFGQNAVVGRKVGLTSAAMQNLLKVDQPDWGVLLKSMDLSGKPSFSASAMIQPKIEPEIAFRLRRDLRGPGVTLVDALAAIDRAYPALEIIDSRIHDWKIGIIDTVADNASSAFFVLAGDGVPVERLDLPAVGMSFRKNGELISTGSGSAVLGHPAAPVAWLANTLAAYGDALLAGQVVLPGALVAAVNVSAGDGFEASFEGLGSAQMAFSE